MKKFFLSFLIIFLSFSSVLAKGFDYRELSNYPVNSANRPLTFGGFLTVYFNSVGEYEGIPESYQYIGLNFPNIERGTPLYKALQKGVYMGFFKNLPKKLKVQELATEEQFARAVESNLGQRLEQIGTGTLTLRTLLDTLSNIYRPTGLGDS